jgi:hypothetical protein
MYTNAQYYNDLSGNPAGIRAEIDGAASFVPLTPGNADYDKIMALVGVGQLVIQDAPLPVSLSAPPVSGRQFKAALALLGVISEAEMISPELPAMVQPVLASMTTQERIVARATWPNLREVRGDEPLLTTFAAAHQPPLSVAEIEQIMAIARSIP